MKTQIDILVRGIQHDLAQPSCTVPDLAAFLHYIGVDGLSRATAQRNILARWSEDMSLCPDVRNYARQQLDALTAF